MTKVMVSMPDDLLPEIDAHVRCTKGSRGAFLATAERHELERRDPEAIHAAVERFRRRFVDVGEFDSTAAVRELRDGRR